MVSAGFVTNQNSRGWSGGSPLVHILKPAFYLSAQQRTTISCLRPLQRLKYKMSDCENGSLHAISTVNRAVKLKRRHEHASDGSLRVLYMPHTLTVVLTAQSVRSSGPVFSAISISHKWMLYLDNTNPHLGFSAEAPRLSCLHRAILNVKCVKTTRIRIQLNTLARPQSLLQANLWIGYNLLPNNPNTAVTLCLTKNYRKFFYTAISI